MLKRKALVGGLAAAACMCLSGVAAGRPRPATDTGFAALLHGTAHCVAGTPGTFSGIVVVHTSTRRNDTRVHVLLLRGMPNKTYYVAIACQRYIGSLATNRRGNGVANIDAPGATSFPFFVDLGVGDGSPAGTADYRIAGPFTGSPGVGGQGLPGLGGQGLPGLGGQGLPGLGGQGLPGLGGQGLPGLIGQTLWPF